MSESVGPKKMLELAREKASNLQFAESLHWYRTFLCHSPGAREVQAEMHQLQRRQSAFEKARDRVHFVWEVCGAFALEDVALREALYEVAPLLAEGPVEDAVLAAERLVVQLEAVIRVQLNLGRDVWGEAASRAADMEVYQLSLQLAERSPKASGLRALYRLRYQTFLLLDSLSPEDRAYAGAGKVESLQAALKRRDPVEIRRCTETLFDSDEPGDGHSYGSGVPVRPRPPHSSGDAERHWPN